jgi:MerR family transcriptional regulator, mercuric resistance operon regulatory protein
MTGLRAGEVAAAAGVRLDTLRYYERRGLISEPDRTLGGQRSYPAETITTVRIVKALQRLGFTLDEIEDLLRAGRHRHRSRDRGLRAAIDAKVADIDRRIADLRSVRASLLAAVSAGCADLARCAGTPGCPIPFSDLGRRASSSSEPVAGHSEDAQVP